MKTKEINLGLKPADSLLEDARNDMDSWGETSLYSTGDPILDEYLGGGYGRCVAGSTKISFRRVGDTTWNNPSSIENLYKRTHGIRTANLAIDVPIEVLGFNEDNNKLEWHRVKDIYKTGKKRCLKITVRNKYGRATELICSEDHPLYTDEGYLKAGDIDCTYKVAMKPQGKEISHIPRDRKRYLVHEVTTCNGNRERWLLHRLVYTAHMNKLTLEEAMYKLYKEEPFRVYIPDSLEVHHKDFDRYNNTWRNLELYTKEAHAKLHAEYDAEHSMKTFMWGDIECIEDAGEVECYDISCEGTHNFFADGVGVHNCNGYEILTIFGDTGMNKSTLATTMILDPASKGTQVAYFALEDDPKDVVKRMIIQCEDDDDKLKKITSNVLFMPENDGYTLDMMANAIEDIFSIADIVVVDPLQFIFEASVAERGETEFNRQRLFMRKMNNIMKHTNKTLIIVSHTSKGGGGKDSKKGLDKIIGSSAVAQVSTKVLEIDRKEDGLQGVRLWKTRFTPYRFTGVQVRLNNMKVQTVYDQADLPQARKLWAGLK